MLVRVSLTTGREYNIDQSQAHKDGGHNRVHAGGQSGEGRGGEGGREEKIRNMATEGHKSL